MSPQSPNKLLAALPRDEYRKLTPFLRSVSLPNESALPHCGHTRVYFPGSGACSITNTMSDGSIIEIASIGNEGMVGLSTLAGDSPPRRNAYLQVGDGTAQYMPLLLFERELARDGPLRDVVDRYCAVFLESMIQSVACNRLHTLQERCCRWLLTTHDRLRRARFELSQRFLARALGVRTSELAAVTMTLGQLGLIKQDAGTVTITDAVGLKRLACKCYGALSRAYGDRVPGPGGGEHARVHAKSAKVLPIRADGMTCTLCGSSLKVPHKSSHDCILAIDAELIALTEKSHRLRKYRAQLLANRADMFRNALRRSGGS
jgi:CRP-like cAMP-binding protein